MYSTRAYLAKPYRGTLDILSEMPHILADIGLEESDLPHHSTLVKAFDRLEMEIWRVLLRLSAQLHDVADHAAMDATFFDRETASKHYCRRTNYRVQTLKTTVLVDTKTQGVLNVHCTTEKRHDKASQVADYFGPESQVKRDWARLHPSHRIIIRSSRERFQASLWSPAFRATASCKLLLREEQRPKSCWPAIYLLLTCMFSPQSASKAVFPSKRGRLSTIPGCTSYHSNRTLRRNYVSRWSGSQ